MRQRECVRILLRIQLNFPNCRGNQTTADCAHGTLIEGYTQPVLECPCQAPPGRLSTSGTYSTERRELGHTPRSESGVFPHRHLRSNCVLIYLFLKGKVENHTDTI